MSLLKEFWYELKRLRTISKVKALLARLDPARKEDADLIVHLHEWLQAEVRDAARRISVWRG